MIDFKGKLGCVLGGSGFLGSPFCGSLLERGMNLRVVARNEGGLIKLKEKYPQIEIVPGNIADPFVVRQAMQGAQMVFNCAASKHVGLSEIYVKETIESNIQGCVNVLNQSLNQKLELLLFISTDKANLNKSVYGSTKMIGERLFKQYENLNSDCFYRVCRYANVAWSTGSVMCKWHDLIKEGKECIITDPNASRYFWGVRQAIDFIYDCIENAKDASPYCPKNMKSIYMGDLLKVMIDKYSNGKNIPIKTIGLQPGENMAEQIEESGLTSAEAEKFTYQEIWDLV